MRPCAIGVAAALIIIAVPRGAAAQLCHLVPVEPHVHGTHDHEAHAPAHHLELALLLENAFVSGGSYQGVAPTLSWHRAPMGASLTVPVYRLDQDGTTATGPGDVAIHAHLEIVRRGRWRTGASIAATLPSGRAEDRLGMGHVMVVPGLWGAASRGRATVITSASLGASIGADPHAHHGATPMPVGSLVSPMNPLEVAATVRASWSATPSLAVHAVTAVAVPVGDGVTRAAVGIGGRWGRGPWALLVDAQAGLIGDPFSVRTVGGIARSF